MKLWTQREIVEALEHIGEIAGNKPPPRPVYPGNAAVLRGPSIQNSCNFVVEWRYSNGQLAQVEAATIGEALEAAIAKAEAY